MKHDWKLVEKNNHLAVHGLFMSQKSAEIHLRDTIPMYCRLNTMSPQDETPAEMLAMLCAWILGTIALFAVAIMLWH